MTGSQPVGGLDPSVHQMSSASGRIFSCSSTGALGCFRARMLGSLMLYPWLNRQLCSRSADVAGAGVRPSCSRPGA